ncbi:hypothetical protein Clacol_000049 [Clathrus columnatus]|uniref:Transmembrane protein 163 n=1 Tax=Clathrus columnatus TaxID=1419009 RepID=A0AAV4ZXZ0_9AGAM|nr:hypothetical protein Clacol_000049 [Clathrus columnatus]
MDNETASISSSLLDELAYEVITRGQAALASLVSLTIIFFVRDIASVVSDALAFIGIIYQIWGVWKSKRNLGLQSNHEKDLVTSLLEQGILSISFALLVTTITSILTIVQPDGVVNYVFDPFQEALSTLIICQFTIALRRRNMKKSTPNLSDIHLPTLTQQSILGRLHESLVVEMAECPDPEDLNNARMEEQDIDNLHVNTHEVHV